MSLSLVTIICALVLLLAAPEASLASSEDCELATEQLHTAQDAVETTKSEVNDAAEAYASCVDGSSEPGECDGEHDELVNDQEELKGAEIERESALANFRLECVR
jgi:hypothetical protein